MPGIAGIISPRPAAECEGLVQAMVGAMQHEGFYRSGFHSAPELGVYAGWVALQEATAARQPFANEAVALLFSGECFGDPSNSEAHPGDGILRAYETHGDQFVTRLNGLFSGLLIDRRQKRALLFNDRYGFDRIYVHEAKDEIYFASEAKALLRVLPQTREFDPEGVGQFLAVGCTLAGQTLFRGLRLLPAAANWVFAPGKCKKECYFSPASWEAQPVLSPEAFQSRFEETLARIVPRYFGTDQKIGIALTAGLDSRMLLACRPAAARSAVCYTYGGHSGEMLDTRLAARVAHTCGMDHHVLRVGSDFFQEFDLLVDQTVYATDGGFGLVGAHEIYFNRQARALSPIRLTGVCGGEVLREVSTFKPQGLDSQLLSRELRAVVAEAAQRFTATSVHPVTFAAFQEIPWNIYGSLSACRSQVTFRTPYLDNELVALAYQSPAALRSSSVSAVRLIQNADPALAGIPTDMGLLGTSGALVRAFDRAYAKVTFKLDYLCNDGLPNGLSFMDPVLNCSNRFLGVPGLHKYLWYRRWFRRELSDHLRERLSDSSVSQMAFWNPSFLGRLATDHINGRNNYVYEINAVLTLSAIQRLLLAGPANGGEVCNRHPGRSLCFAAV